MSEHDWELSAEVHRLRARIKDLESAQGARVPEAERFREVLSSVATILRSISDLGRDDDATVDEALEIIDAALG